MSSVSLREPDGLAVCPAHLRRSCTPEEDTRRAMNKSMQTSGGTCLSTNWGEVKEKDYESEKTAPKGMEWKKYPK